MLVASGDGDDKGGPMTPLEIFKAATHTLTAELAQLRKQRAVLVSWKDRGETLERNVGELVALAGRRLVSEPNPAWVTELYGLLELRVTVLDDTKTPALQVEGGVLFERVSGLLGSCPTVEPKGRAADRAQHRSCGQWRDAACQQRCARDGWAGGSRCARHSRTEMPCAATWLLPSRSRSISADSGTAAECSQ